MKEAFPDLGHYKNAQSAVRTKSGGFTLVELLMCIAILSIIFGTVNNTFDIFSRSFNKENVRAGVQQKARIAINLMAQDIRLAGLYPKGEPAGGILVAEPTKIQFTADLNYDGDLNGDYEDITYALNGDKVEQTNHLGTETLVDNVTGLSFTYLDKDEGTPSEAEDIRTVIIALTVQKPAGREGPISRTYTTRVRCRNL